MPDRITKTQRWLDLIALLLGRRVPLAVEEIMERVPAYAAGWCDGSETDRATARRMFERDKDELREMGIPLDTTPYRVGADEFEGYRIARRDFYLPYLKLVAAGEADGDSSSAAPRHPPLPEVELAPAEASLALDALRRVADLPAFPYAAEARSAIRKLSFDLDSDGLGDDPVRWVERPGARDQLDRLRVLSAALLARKRVGFSYHGIHRGSSTRREVEPYGLFFQRDWYLVAHDRRRAALRVFRVARMEEVEPNGGKPKQPDFEIPPDFRLADHLDRSAWELGDEEEATEALVHFRFPLSIRAERNGEGERISEDAEGGAVRRFRVAQPGPFVRWVLSQGGEATVLEPPELRAACADMAREVAGLYAEAAGG